MRHWLVKQEPTAYSWDDFTRDGSTAWTGVRNFQERNHLAAMKRGDRVLLYHSVVGKAIVGIAEVVRESFPDPTDAGWICVELKPWKPLEHPVTLETIKAHPQLQEIGLIRQSRLSVMPLEKEAFQTIVALGREARAGG